MDLEFEVKKEAEKDDFSNFGFEDYKNFENDKYEDVNNNHDTKTPMLFQIGNKKNTHQLQHLAYHLIFMALWKKPFQSSIMVLRP